MSKLALDISHFAIETALLLWFFEAVKPERRPGAARSACALLCVASTLPLYLYGHIVPVQQSGFTIMVIRFVYRTAACAAYLMLAKRISWRRAVYFAGIYSLVFHAHLNIFGVPLLASVKSNTALITQSEGLSFIICQLIMYAPCALMLDGVRRNVPFGEIKRIGTGRAVLLIVASLCVLYVKTSLTLLNGAAPGSVFSISVFVILLQILLVVMLVCMEAYLNLRRRQEEEHIQEVSNAYALKSLKNWQTGAEDIRALAHDMKNHLLTIRGLAADGADGRVEEYVGELLESFEIQDRCIETGSGLLNGLISEKAAEGAREGVQFSVVLDYGLISFVSDSDICTIFGNALDNALEASSRAEPRPRRYISLYGARAAGQAVITIANAYDGKLEVRGGLPVTMKKEPGHHGIGLRSIERAIKKYDGIMTFGADDEKFQLTLMLPIPERQ